MKDKAIKEHVKRNHDEPNAKVFMRRIRNARDASSLQVLLQPGFPGNWELLKGDRHGQISATLRGGKRLICIPNGNLDDFCVEGNLHAKLIEEMIIIGIENYHG